MRVLLLVHEGELDYCTLSDGTRDCEVTAFIGGIKLCQLYDSYTHKPPQRGEMRTTSVR